MRRSVSILVILAWLALGTGLLPHLHALQHRAEDGHAELPLHHGDAKCHLCAGCHTPVMAADPGATLDGDAPLAAVVPVTADAARVPAGEATHTCRGPPYA